MGSIFTVILRLIASSKTEMVQVQKLNKKHESDKNGSGIELVHMVLVFEIVRILNSILYIASI